MKIAVLVLGFFQPIISMPKLSSTLIEEKQTVELAAIPCKAKIYAENVNYTWFVPNLEQDGQNQRLWMSVSLSIIFFGICYAHLCREETAFATLGDWWKKNGKKIFNSSVITPSKLTGRRDLWENWEPNSNLVLSPSRFGYSFFSCSNDSGAWSFKSLAWIDPEFLR